MAGRPAASATRRRCRNTPLNQHQPRDRPADPQRKSFPGFNQTTDAGCRQGLRLRRLRQGFAPSLRHAACGAEGPILGDRRPNHPASRLRCLAEVPQEDRRAVRLGQDGRADGADHAAEHQTGRRPVHPDDGSEQPRPTAEVAGRMSPQMRIQGCPMRSETEPSSAKFCARQRTPFCRRD